MQAAEPQHLPIDPRIRQRRVEVHRAVGRRRLRVAVGLTAGATVVVGAVAVLHTPLVGARHLRVEGVTGVAAGEVLRAGSLRRGEPLIDVQRSAAAAGIERLAWVASAEVTRSWPWSVTVRVTRRRVVAEVDLTSKATGPVAFVDVTGRVLGSAPQARPDLAVLSVAGRIPTTGGWLPGAPGAGHAPGSPATLAPARPLAAADGGPALRAGLAIAATYSAAGGSEAAIQIEVGRQGLAAHVGATEVDFGGTTELAAKVAALRTLEGAGALAGAASVDLQAPSRPAIDPAGTA